MGKIKDTMMERDSKTSEACVRSLLWLKERGARGVLDRQGYVVAQGDVSKGTAPETWLRLVALGFISGCRNSLESPYLFITTEGYQFLERNNL